VPLTVRWPSVVKPGSHCDTPTVAMDFLPTLAAVLGQKAPEPMDGLNILPLWKDTGTIARDTLYWHYPHYMFSNGGTVIRQGDFKLLQLYADGRVELYDLSKDIGEETNLANAMPERVKRMQDQLRRWQKDVGASMPTRDARPHVSATASPPTGSRQVHEQ
ncbi:MAG: sulfatase/phosphatase domain-containing protein, partial [Planctomycetota bacterium]